MARKNKSRYALLGVLSLSPGSGYDIKKFCDVSIAHFWNENYGHIYPVLKQLYQEGLVEVMAEQNEGRPTRQIYSITEAGRRELEQWLADPVEDVPERNELLLKLFFGSQLPLEDTLSKLEQEKEKQQVRLAQYEEVAAVLRPAKGMPGAPFWLASVSWGLHHAKSKIAWCDESIEMLSANTEKLGQASDS